MSVCLCVRGSLNLCYADSANNLIPRRPSEFQKLLLFVDVTRDGLHGGHSNISDWNWRKWKFWDPTGYYCIVSFCSREDNWFLYHSSEFSTHSCRTHFIFLGIFVSVAMGHSDLFPILFWARRERGSVQWCGDTFTFIFINIFFSFIHFVRYVAEEIRRPEENFFFV